MEAIAAAGAGDGSAGQEFLANWRLGDRWRAEFESRLAAYYQAVVQRLKDEAGFFEIVRLAESGRRRVRALELSEARPLLFASTTKTRLCWSCAKTVSVVAEEGG